MWEDGLNFFDKTLSTLLLFNPIRTGLLVFIWLGVKRVCTIYIDSILPPLSLFVFLFFCLWLCLHFVFELCWSGGDCAQFISAVFCYHQVLLPSSRPAKTQPGSIHYLHIVQALKRHKRTFFRSNSSFEHNCLHNIYRFFVLSVCIKALNHNLQI